MSAQDTAVYGALLQEFNVARIRHIQGDQRGHRPFFLTVAGHEHGHRGAILR